jgi:hypothetical protein
MKIRLSLFALLISGGAFSQIMSPTGNKPPTKPEDTEVYEPAVKAIQAGKTPDAPPSDAVILFDGKNLDEWVSSRDKSAAKWKVENGSFVVNKQSGDIQTKKNFTNYQLHLEYQIPTIITGSGQSRGNSGIFLAATNGKAGGYEIQVLDGYNNENKTYVNGMVGSLYKQAIPLVNPSKKAGEWNVYDILWTAPVFNEDGTVKTKARVTVMLNNVVVQNNTEVQGETAYIGAHEYVRHGPAPIKLQAHGDRSEPISFRNIWLREL